MAVMMNAYLNFNGKSEEVLNFYKQVFGGEVEISRFADFPNTPVAEEHKNLVMHGVLKTDSWQLMIADANPMGEVNPGNSISLSLSGDDSEKLNGYFSALSKGGTVSYPIEKAPWGDSFGMLVDKFGIQWMVNITTNK